MKKISAPTKPAREKTDVEKAIGGQPENDADARDAGLHSATSASPDEKTKRADVHSSRQPKKANKR